MLLSPHPMGIPVEGIRPKPILTGMAANYWEIVLLSIAVGYPDWDDPMNQFRTEREFLENIAMWHGF